MYFRSSIKCKRKEELEVSKLEALRTKIYITNSKPFLSCSLYRPTNASSDWTVLFEMEVSIAQTTGLEIFIMGDFNIEYSNCKNKKWLHLTQLLLDFSLTVKEATLIFISGRGSAISSAKQGKSGFIYNLVKR